MLRKVGLAEFPATAWELSQSELSEVLGIEFYVLLIFIIIV